MVRELTITQIEDYLRCSLYYRYAHELRLPHYTFDPEDNYLNIIKKITNHWFNLAVKGITPKEIRARLSNLAPIIKTQVQVPIEDYPLLHARMMGVALKLERIVKIGKDEIISGRLDLSMAIENTMFIEQIDGFYIHKRGTKRGMKNRYAVAVQITDKRRKLSPRVIKLKESLIRKCIYMGLEKSNIHVKLLRIQLPSLSTYWLPLHRKADPEFDALAGAIVRHLNHKMYLPTITPNVCMTCPYSPICNNKFCNENISNREIEKARTKLLQSGLS